MSRGVSSADKPRVQVAIAIVWRAGKLLVTRRPASVHLGGFWEFPGGKVARGESPEACAERELVEEVRVTARARRVRPPIEWEYAERHVTLHPVECDWVAGEGSAREVAELRWARPAELAALDFPPANAALVQALVNEARTG